jgi:hypothetical protein
LERREKSDFLCYRNHAGLYADFHSCRHSDIRLTLGVYTHAELADQSAAIEALPGPPGARSNSA